MRCAPPDSLAARAGAAYVSSQGESGMFKRSRSFLIAAVALLALVVIASPNHRADIRILTHRSGDIAPQKAQAIVDIGLASVSVLVTWSKRLGY
jgi:hypothetical protein